MSHHHLCLFSWNVRDKSKAVLFWDITVLGWARSLVFVANKCRHHFGGFFGLCWNLDWSKVVSQRQTAELSSFIHWIPGLLCEIWHSYCAYCAYCAYWSWCSMVQWRAGDGVQPVKGKSCVPIAFGILQWWSPTGQSGRGHPGHKSRINPSSCGDVINLQIMTWYLDPVCKPILFLSFCIMSVRRFCCNASHIYQLLSPLIALRG